MQPIEAKGHGLAVRDCFFVADSELAVISRQSVLTLMVLFCLENRKQSMLGNFTVTRKLGLLCLRVL